MKSIPTTLLALLTLAAAWASAQPTPASTPGADIQILAVDFLKEPAPGGGKPWGKIVIKFLTRPAWSDGLVLGGKVLVEKDGASEIITGSVTYLNVPTGNHTGILYLSPGNLERFGEPVVMEINATMGDSSPTVFQTKPKGKVDKDWTSQFNYRAGLLPVFQTPFVATETGRGPDYLSR